LLSLSLDLQAKLSLSLSRERESREAVRDKIVDQCSAVLVEFKPGSSESYLLQLLSGEDRNIFEHDRRESPAKRGA